MKKQLILGCKTQRNYAVINEDVDETVKNIETIIDAEKFRVVKGEKYD